jgi:hypothetical protein
MTTEPRQTAPILCVLAELIELAHPGCICNCDAATSRCPLIEHFAKRMQRDYLEALHALQQALYVARDC